MNKILIILISIFLLCILGCGKTEENTGEVIEQKVVKEENTEKEVDVIDTPSEEITPEEMLLGVWEADLSKIDNEFKNMKVKHIFTDDGRFYETRTLNGQSDIQTAYYYKYNAENRVLICGYRELPEEVKADDPSFINIKIEELNDEYMLMEGIEYYKVKSLEDAMAIDVSGEWTNCSSYGSDIFNDVYGTGNYVNYWTKFLTFYNDGTFSATVCSDDGAIDEVYGGKYEIVHDNTGICLNNEYYFGIRQIDNILEIYKLGDGEVESVLYYKE